MRIELKEGKKERQNYVMDFYFNLFEKLAIKIS